MMTVHSVESVLGMRHGRRRRMRTVVSGLLTALFLLSVGLVAAAPSARADDFCDGDPVVSLDGQIYTIVIRIWGDPATVRRSVREADITLVVPSGTRTAVLRTISPYFAEDV